MKLIESGNRGAYRGEIEAERDRQDIGRKWGIDGNRLMSRGHMHMGKERYEGKKSMQ